MANIKDLLEYGLKVGDTIALRDKCINGTYAGEICKIVDRGDDILAVSIYDPHHTCDCADNWVKVSAPMGYEYYVGQKLYMVKDVDGKGKGKIVTVAKLTNDGGIDYIMTDGTWGWEREAYNYLGMFPPSARFWNVRWAEEGTFRPVGGAAQRRAYGLEEYKIWWDHRVKKLTTEAKSPEQKVNILNAFQKLFMDVDAQTLRKAGYIHEDSTLTDEGSDALNAILVKDNKVEFVNAAQAKLDEIEKADKK